MNLELLESFGQNYPEDFDGTLDCMSVAITCQFNRYIRLSSMKPQNLEVNFYMFKYV